MCSLIINISLITACGSLHFIFISKMLGKLTCSLLTYSQISGLQSQLGEGATVAEWQHSRLPPLRPGFDPRHGRKWESW